MVLREFVLEEPSGSLAGQGQYLGSELLHSRARRIVFHARALSGAGVPAAPAVHRMAERFLRGSTVS